MSSQKRIDSSRANGALSRGPATPEGKARSAKSLVLSNEDAGAFETLIAGYEAYFAPQTPIQHDLVEEIAAARWRQRRIWNIQTAAVDHEMDRQEPALKAEYAQIDECTRIALAVKHITDNSKLLSNLSRYESRHRRAYDRAVETLESQEKNVVGKNEPTCDTEKAAVRPCWFICVYQRPPKSAHHSIAILTIVTPPDDPILSAFHQTGAYLRGHFRLTSGLHSPEYLQCALVLQHPEHAESFGRSLAAQLPKVPTVVSPAMGGLIIGHEVARALGARFLFTERDAAGKMVLRRGFTVEPGESVVVIEDVITTGGSTREVIDLLRETGANVLAAGSIIDRSGGQADVGVPRVALKTLQAVTYDPAQCPLCAAGSEAVKPGSRKS